MSQQLTITGRFVQGSLTLQPKKDDQGKPVLDDQGKQVQESFIAVAVPKNDPQIPAYMAAYAAQAQTSFPQLFVNGQCQHPRFAWKIQDGDGIDKNGKSVKDKPGFAGCYVFKMATRFAPRCYIRDGHGNLQELTEPEKIIKKGYQVAVSVTIDGNKVGTNAGAAVPGLYASPNLVLFVAPGEEIATGPDPNQAFAGVQAQAPTQMPAVAGLAPPPQPAGLPMPGVGVQQQPAGLPMPGVGVQQQPAGLPMPGVGVQQQPAGLPMPQQQQQLPAGLPMPGANVAQPAQPVYQMTPAAMGATREQLLGANMGWTDEALLAQGMMVRVA